MLTTQMAKQPDRLGDSTTTAPKFASPRHRHPKRRVQVKETSRIPSHLQSTILFYNHHFFSPVLPNFHFLTNLTNSIKVV